jgi:hypothetical protein
VINEVHRHHGPGTGQPTFEKTDLEVLTTNGDIQLAQSLGKPVPLSIHRAIARRHHRDPRRSVLRECFGQRRQDIAQATRFRERRDFRGYMQDVHQENLC